MDNLRKHYNLLASKREQYYAKNSYYYKELFRNYQYYIPKGKRVLEIGCGLGDLLAEVSPDYGVGVDISDQMIALAHKRHPNLNFHEGSIASLPAEQFDYIILSGVLGEVENIQELLEALKPFCSKNTRIIIEYYSYFWQYILKMGEAFDWKVSQKLQNWITHGDLCNFLTLSGYEPVKYERRMLFPKYVPIISYLFNRIIANLPLINHLTLNHFIIARPAVQDSHEYSVTILVPCRNEKGNIESAITRTPVFGTHQEFIFVEGNSQDNTYEEVERVMKEYPDRDIKLFSQQGKGKGDAVRLGFSKATCDILMILDADLTMPPEDLPKYYEAIRSNKGEFINGCRLIYPMEKEAMRLLNLIANKFFGLFFSWLLGQRFKDTLCGTKVMFRQQYEELVTNRSYFGDFDPFGDFDLIFGATKLNLKVLELPIRYRDRAYGSTQIQRFRHGILLFRMCWFAMKKIKFR